MTSADTRIKPIFTGFSETVLVRARWNIEKSILQKPERRVCGAFYFCRRYDRALGMVKMHKIRERIYAKWLNKTKKDTEKRELSAQGHCIFVYGVLKYDKKQSKRNNEIMRNYHIFSEVQRRNGGPSWREN